MKNGKAAKRSVPHLQMQLNKPVILAYPFETVSTSKQSSDLLVPVPYILQPIILLSWNSFQDKTTVHNTDSASRFTARQIDWTSCPLRQMWAYYKKNGPPTTASTHYAYCKNSLI